MGLGQPTEKQVLQSLWWAKSTAADFLLTPNRGVASYLLPPVAFSHFQALLFAAEEHLGFSRNIPSLFADGVA